MVIIKINKNSVSVILPVILVCLLIIFTFTPFFVANNYKLSIGVIFDLVFAIPLFHILLSKRHRNLKYSASAFFTVGILVAGIIIPKSDQLLLLEIKRGLVPVVELFAIIFFVFKTKKTLVKLAVRGAINEDFYTVFKDVVNDLMPKKLASVIIAEVSAFYYGFFYWRKPALDNKNFSYHKKTGIVGFIGVFIFMLLIETTILHLLLAKWNSKVAWLLSGLSFYAALQAFGIARSIVKRPIQITDEQLIIRYGILAEATIDLNDILSIEVLGKSVLEKGNIKYISPFRKIENPNIIIRVSYVNNIDRIYGSKKPFDVILITVDERHFFVEQTQFLLKTREDGINKMA